MDKQKQIPKPPTPPPIRRVRDSGAPFGIVVICGLGLLIMSVLNILYV